MNQVMYIKYQGNKRTTIKASVGSSALVIKYDTVKPLVVAQDTDTEQAYMDLLTERMFEKIRINKLRLKGELV